MSLLAKAPILLGAALLTLFVPYVHAAESDLPDLGEPLQLAQADTDTAAGDESQSEQCLAFAKDPDADLGEVLRAGCQPTLAQMSALMDNPLGNVAMLFNQYDSYHMKNDANGKEAIQGNFMGIFQFPKSLNEDWNLINRIIYNVPSVPLDQGKLDRLNAGSTGTPPGSINPGPAPALIDLASGRTTGFGDLYYVLFIPSFITRFHRHR